ncbi:hypothetical protein [Streptomyces sp. SLBN-31]|uniref:hypothetical protein n=1 Tax=Streptomyces sp. SLBN-31 TaxID=2768444 RepID=UPI00157674B9
MRHVQGGAQIGQFGLVGEKFGWSGRHRREQIGGDEVAAQRDHRDGARVVRRDQHGRTGEPRGHPAQRQGDLVRG